MFDVHKFSINKLIHLVGAETVQEHVHDGEECPPDKHDLKLVRAAIADSASNRIF